LGTAFENIDTTVMDKNNIPNELQHLLPLVEKWGIQDDGYRDEQIEKANINELKKIIESLPDETMKRLNKWFKDNTDKPSGSKEYISYICYVMAYEYAEIVVSDRQSGIV